MGRPVFRQIKLQPGVCPAAPAVVSDEAVPKRLRRRILRQRVHRATNPKPSPVEAVRAILNILAELLDQFAADFLHEIAAALLELLVAAVPDGTEWGRCCGMPLILFDVAVAVHLAQNVIATVERLLRRSDGIVVRRRLGQDGEIGGLRQRQLIDVLVEIGARRRLNAI